jgi:hypothetical protein
MYLKPAALAAVGLACVWGQSYAQDATLPRLASLQGLVLVDHGDGFVAASPGSPFRGGDRVTTAPGGFAKISYADGCDVTVNSRSMATIDSASPCDGGPAPQLLKTADDTTTGGGTAYAGPGLGAGVIIGGLALFGIGVAVGAVVVDHNHHVEISVSP